MSRRSEIWVRKHFQVFSDPGYSRKRGKCLHCGDKVVDTLERMKYHLTGKPCDVFQVKKDRKALPRAIDQYIVQITRREADELDLKAAIAIFVDGLPFGAFDSHLGRLLASLKSNWKPPGRTTIATTLLDHAYDLYWDRLKPHFEASNRMNVIFDETGDISGNRIMNISIQVDSGAVFFLKNVDLGSATVDAEQTFNIIHSELSRLTNNQLKRISSFTTDTCAHNRKFFKLIQANNDLRHYFTVLYDSHGLNLLVSDILKLKRWKQITKQTMNILTYLRGSNK